MSAAPDLGVRNGRLAACPGTPNCVCSQAADAAHRIDPLKLDGDAAAAWQRLRQVVTAQPRAAIVSEKENYLRAEFTSRIFRFVDDVEFYLAPADGVIHCRSASRIGRSDLGVNRQRIETIRSQFNAAPR